MYLLLFLAASGALIGGIELVKRKSSLSSNMSRRMAHIGATLIAALAPLFLNQSTIVVVCLLIALAVFLARRTTLLSSIHSVDRPSFGDVFLPLGEAIAAIVFLPHNVAAFQFGVLVMGVSDALAGLIGEKYGTHSIRFLNNSKSAEGSATFFATTLILTLFFEPALGYHTLLIPILLTLIEFVGIFGLDNLVLPIAGASLLQLFQ